MSKSLLMAVIYVGFSTESIVESILDEFASRLPFVIRALIFLPGSQRSFNRCVPEDVARSSPAQPHYLSSIPGFILSVVLAMSLSPPR